MNQVKLNEQTFDEFAVTDVAGNPVTGLSETDFTWELYDPAKTEVSGSVTVHIDELGGGLYRLRFTPNALGEWAINVFHSTYFPWGKSGNFYCLAANVDDLYHIEYGRWKIESNQMIFFKDDNVTEVARFDLKDGAGSPSMTNVFERVKT